MSQVLPQLFVGPIDHIYDAEFLTENNITHIVSIFDMDVVTRAMVDRHVKHMWIQMYDTDETPIYEVFEKTTAFIKAGLAKGGGVYIHCFVGVSRSPTIVAAYLIKERGMTAEETLDHLRRVRPIVDPNDGFKAALRRWEADQPLV